MALFEQITPQTGRVNHRQLAIWLFLAPPLLLLLLSVMDVWQDYGRLVASALVNSEKPVWSDLIPSLDEILSRLGDDWRLLVFALPFFIGLGAWMLWRARHPDFARDLTDQEVTFVRSASHAIEEEVRDPIPGWYRAVVWGRRMLVVAAYVLFALLVLPKTFFLDVRDDQSRFDPLVKIDVPNPWVLAIAIPLIVILLLHGLSYAWSRFAELEYRRGSLWMMMQSWWGSFSRSLAITQLRMGLASPHASFDALDALRRQYRAGELPLLIATILLVVLVFTPIPSEVIDFLNPISASD
jgi:hypothetical protein